MSLRSRIPVMLAAALAVVPTVTWAWSAGPRALNWYGLGLMTGFAAAGLFAVSMLLMLRLRWLDRVFGGLGYAYQAHQVLGLCAFVLMLVHPLALALGVLRARPPQALHLLLPNLSSALVLSGWLSLLLFVVFFVVTVSPRLPYDLWLGLHRASGFAYAAMTWHLIAVRSGSVSAGLCLTLVAAGLFGYAHRLLVQDPLRRGLRYRVTDVHHRAPHVVDLVLEPEGEQLRFSAGQFVYLLLRDSPSYRACGEAHPYTLTGRPDDARLHLAIKSLGGCTQHIQSITPGVEAIVQGPFGGLFPAGVRNRPQIWVGGGIGVTPFLSRAATAPSDGPPIDIIYAAADPRAAPYLEDLSRVARDHSHMRVHTIFESSDGLPTVDAIASRTGPLDGKEVMLAGPPAMVRALRRELRARGVPLSRIHSEEGVLR